MTKTVRIGCAAGFYGDSQLSARQLVDKGNIDYLVFDYLAEVTMAILAKQKAKNENMGFALDFVTVAMKDVLADCAARGIKVVANAGGVNVPACIAALQQLCVEQGLDLKIGGGTSGRTPAKRSIVGTRSIPDTRASRRPGSTPGPRIISGVRMISS